MGNENSQRKGSAQTESLNRTTYQELNSKYFYLQKGSQEYQWNEETNRYEKDNGNYYIGTIVDDLFEGFGILSLNKGVYTGNFVKGWLQGCGTFEDNQLSYKGQFKDGIICGFGHVIFKHDKSFYIGYWDDQQRNGLGIYKSKYFLFCGEWEKNKIVKHMNQNLVIFPSEFDHLIMNPSELDNGESKKNK